MKKKKDNGESKLSRNVWNGDGVAVVTKKEDIVEYIRYKIPVGEYNFVYFEAMLLRDGLYQTGWLDENLIEAFCQQFGVTRDDFKTINAAEMHKFIKTL